MQNENVLDIQQNKTIGEETIKREQMGNSPFYAIGNDDIGYHLVCGNHRLTETSLPTMDEVDEYMILNNWTLIAQFISIMVPAILADQKEEEETNN